jgi:hypothetical protein
VAEEEEEEKQKKSQQKNRSLATEGLMVRRSQVMKQKTATKRDAKSRTNTSWKCS